MLKIWTCTALNIAGTKTDITAAPAICLTGRQSVFKFVYLLTASPPLGQYQIILLDDRSTCLNIMLSCYTIMKWLDVKLKTS